MHGQQAIVPAAGDGRQRPLLFIANNRARRFTGGQAALFFGQQEHSVDALAVVVAGVLSVAVGVDRPAGAVHEFTVTDDRIGAWNHDALSPFQGKRVPRFLMIGLLGLWAFLGGSSSAPLISPRRSLRPIPVSHR